MWVPRKVFVRGGSLAINLPKTVVEEFNIEKGERLYFEIERKIQEGKRIILIDEKNKDKLEEE